jgi:preprotein translocase subunit SecA
MRMSGGGESAPARPAGQARPASRAAEAPKAGRNDPCPCGSGKKFKKCHGS